MPTSFDGLPSLCISATRPSVSASAMSISPWRSAFVMAPVPPGKSLHSMSRPAAAKRPLEVAVCHGVLKCSGTPPTRRRVRFAARRVAIAVRRTVHAKKVGEIRNHAEDQLLYGTRTTVTPRRAVAERLYARPTGRGRDGSRASPSARSRSRWFVGGIWSRPLLRLVCRCKGPENILPGRD